MTNKEAFWAFARGLTFGLSAVGLFFCFVIMLNGNSEKENSAKFKVVDKYRYCDVVQYAPDGAARYYYFLDCNATGQP